MIVIANGEQIECAKAVKGKDRIYLYDEFDNKICSFEGVSSFDGYSIEGGEWETPEPTEKERLEAVENALLEMVLGGM